MRQSKTLKPFFVVMSLFSMAAFSGVTAMTPFIVQIMKAYDSPIAPDRTATLVSIANNLGMFALLVFIHITGKRPLYLTMLSGVLVSAAVVCAYGFIWLPSGYNSFDQATFVSNGYLPYIPFVGMLLWHGFTCCGIYSLPWQWLSEAFPYRTRALTSGIASALYYVLTFIATKTYYSLEMKLSLPGVTLFNCVVIAIGVVLMYNILPETEGRTLEEIEMHFSDTTKSITNRKISKISPNAILWFERRLNARIELIFRPLLQKINPNVWQQFFSLCFYGQRTSNGRVR